MQRVKKVSNQEIIDSLKDTIKKNNNALEFVTAEIQKYDDFVHYNENDVISKECLQNLKYIEFTLKYLDKQYCDALRLRGVRL